MFSLFSLLVLTKRRRWMIRVSLSKAYPTVNQEMAGLLLISVYHESLIGGRDVRSESIVYKRKMRAERGIGLKGIGTHEFKA
jgi:hypothetical protein